MDEAEQCDRLAVMREGSLVALGSPEALKKEIGGDVLVIQGEALPALAQEVEARLHVKPQMVDGKLQIEHKEGHRFIAQLVEAFPGKIKSVTFRKPTLEDVFIRHTGHQFWADGKAQA
jgi:ABC-2 type transport system ATP-binding protein